MRTTPQRRRRCLPRRTDVEARKDVKQITLEAVVIRADGTREDLGVVSYWHKNPLRRLAFKLKRK